MTNLDKCIQIIRNKFARNDKRETEHMENLAMVQIWHLIGHIATDKFNEGMKNNDPGYEPIGIKVKGE